MLNVYVNSFRWAGCRVPVVVWKGTVTGRWHATVAHGICHQSSTSEILRSAGITEGDYSPGCLHTAYVSHSEAEGVFIHAASLPFVTPWRVMRDAENRVGILSACSDLFAQPPEDYGDVNTNESSIIP